MTPAVALFSPLDQLVARGPFFLFVLQSAILYLLYKNMKTFVFDFDGVIGNTFELYAEFLAKFMRISLPRARRYMREHSLNNRKQSLVKTLGKNFYMRRFEAYVKRQLDRDILFPEVLEQIELLSGNKYIVSRNHVRVCLEILQEQAILFKEVYGYNNAKSKVHALRNILHQDDLVKEDLVFVSDTIGDFAEVTQILKPSQVYLVTWGFNTAETIVEYDQSIQTLHSPQELAALNQLH